MAYEVLTDSGYSIPTLFILSVLNLALMVYLLVFVISLPELIVISIIIFAMFIVQVFTNIKIRRTLQNAFVLVFLSVNAIVIWQIHRYISSAGEKSYFDLIINLAAIAGWMLTALFLGRHWYGYLEIAKQKP